MSFSWDRCDFEYLYSTLPPMPPVVLAWTPPRFWLCWLMQFGSLTFGQKYGLQCTFVIRQTPQSKPEFNDNFDWTRLNSAPVTSWIITINEQSRHCPLNSIVNILITRTVGVRSYKQKGPSCYRLLSVLFTWIFHCSRVCCHNMITDILYVRPLPAKLAIPKIKCFTLRSIRPNHE